MSDGGGGDGGGGGAADANATESTGLLAAAQHIKLADKMVKNEDTAVYKNLAEEEEHLRMFVTLMTHPLCYLMVNAREREDTLMEWCPPTILKRGVSEAPPVSVSSLGVWYSKLRLPLYADVRVTHSDDSS